VNQVC